MQPFHMDEQRHDDLLEPLPQLGADTGYSLPDLPGAMDDRDGWRERESQRDTCWQRDVMMMMMMMMMMMKKITLH